MISLLRTTLIAFALLCLVWAAGLELSAAPQQEPALSSKPYAGVGILVAINKETGGFSVIGVADKSPAALHGIKEGDELLEVDSRPVKHKDIQSVLSAIGGSVGASVTLKLARDNQPYTVELERALITIDKAKVSE